MTHLSATENKPDFECTCATSPTCSDKPHCICIYTYDDGVCYCTCSDDAVVVARDIEVPDRAQKLDLYESVKLSAKGVDLGMLAVFLTGVCEAEILVPASLLPDEAVVEITKAPLGDVIKQLGLAVKAEAA